MAVCTLKEVQFKAGVPDSDARRRLFVVDTVLRVLPRPAEGSQEGGSRRFTRVRMINCFHSSFSDLERAEPVSYGYCRKS